jgi:integrase
VAGTNRTAARSRDRVLTDLEIAAIWRACGDDDYGRIVRLLILTGQRRDEVGGMARSEIDLLARKWTIPGERTKNGRTHEVPLSNEAIAILEAGIAAAGERELLFGERPTTPFSGWSKAKARLDRRVEAAPWTLHDLRRTTATRMAELGVLPHIIEAALNHVSGHRAGVAGIYNRASYTAEIARALDAWAGLVARIIDPRENVVTFARDRIGG